MCAKLKTNDEFQALREWRCGLPEEAGTPFCQREAAAHRLKALSRTGTDDDSARREIIVEMAALDQAMRDEEEATGVSRKDAFNSRKAQWCADNTGASICPGSAATRAAAGGAHRLSTGFGNKSPAGKLAAGLADPSQAGP